MPNRVIREGLIDSERVQQLDEPTQLFFVKLMLKADDYGSYTGNSHLLRAALYPFGTDSVLQDIPLRIERCIAAGLISVYAVGGLKYLYIHKFGQHVRQKKRRFPEPPKNICDPNEKPMNSDCAAIDVHSCKQESLSYLLPTRAESESETNLNLNPKLEKKKQRQKDRQTLVENRIFDLWCSAMNHPHAKLDRKRRAKIRDRLKDGYTEDQLKTAIAGCRNSPHHMGQNDRGTVYDDLELICRDASHVDKFIKLASANGNVLQLSTAGRRTAEAGLRWLNKNPHEENGNGSRG